MATICATSTQQHLHLRHCTRVQACPCGCRSRPLSDTRLRQHGLRGFSVISSSTGMKRFLHPGEAGFLNTLMPSTPLPGPARHALRLIGQLAIFGHIVNWVIHINTGRPKRSPVGMIQEYQHKLLQDRLLRWITPSMFMLRTLTLTEDGEPDALITLDKPTTLAQLKKAETSLQGWGAAIHVYPAGYNKTDNEHQPGMHLLRDGSLLSGSRAGHSRPHLG